MQTTAQTNDSGHVAGGKTEADTSAHTATPWREEDGKIYGVENGEEVLICDVAPDNNALTEFDVANAEFIVRACNRDHAFDDLVKALKWLVDTCGAPGFSCNTPTLVATDVEEARAALAKAGVK